MAYCSWSDVESVFEGASTIEPVVASQTALLVESTALTDAYLAGIIRTPHKVAVTEDYDPLIVRINALFCADLVASRRFDGPEDQESIEYDGNVYTGTRFGHKAMSTIQAMRQAKAFTEEQDTEPDLSKPLMNQSGMSGSNGIIEARFLMGRFMREVKTVYKVAIATAADAGTVADETLSFTVNRDYDEDLWAAADPLSVTDTGWINIEYGLQVRFRDASSSALWQTDDYFEITCEPFTDRVESAGVTTREVHLG